MRLRLGAVLGLLAIFTLGVCAQRSVTVEVQTMEDKWGEQLAGAVVEVTLGSVALRNIRLRGGRVVAVRLLAAAQEGAAAIPLDWEQQYSDSSMGSGSSSSDVLATLPADVSWKDVSQVVARCQACSGYSGAFALTTVQPQAAAGLAVVFEFGGLHFSSRAVQRQPAASSILNAAAKTASFSDSRRRKLQQGGSTASPTPLPECSLQVGDQQLEFEGCLSVPLTPPATYEVYYTLAPSSNGGTLWSGGLKIDVAAGSGQWAGFGFPEFPASMLGANAVVVKQCAACPSGASVDGYQLAGYNPTDNVAGSFALTDTSAAQDADGTLVAAFTAELPQPPEQLMASAFPFIYAFGPLAADGSLQSHPAVGRPYGGNTLMLAQGMSSDAAPAPDGQDDPATDTAAPTPGLSSQPSSPPPPPPSPAGSTPAASAPPASSDGAGTDGSPACLLSLGEEELNFAACTPIDNIGTDFSLLWSLEPSDGTNSTLQIGLRAAAGGWVAVGFPESPRRMLGATSMILKSCADCSSGAEIQDYFLASRTPSGVQPPGQLPVSDASAAVGSDGVMQGTIKVQLDSAVAGNPAFPIILAAGPLDSSGGLLQHDNFASSTVNWASGSSSSIEGEPAHITSMKNAHGWLMAIGWGVLIPLGILTARHGKDVKPPLWFHLHRGIQVLGFACAVAAFIIIFIAVEEATGSSVSTYTVHRRLGISAMAMGGFQVTALLLRPHKGTRLRPYWEFAHHWVGRAAAIVAVANIYEGIINVRDVGTWAVVTYSVIFGLIVVTGLGLDAYKLLTVDRSGKQEGVVNDSPPNSALDHKSLGRGTDEEKSSHNV